MRREPLFSRSGYYRFLLDCNALLHREAAAATRTVLAEQLESGGAGQRVRVLDLACGGLPLTIADVMGSFPAHNFDYTGVDLNPDQVAETSRYRFPANVTASRVLEGNAWDLEALGIGEGFDLIYSGMNLHHGTPEEICFLGLQLLRLLTRHGIFVSHDVYRPSDAPYRRRPDTNPADPGESWRLVRRKRLCRAGVLASAVPEDLAPEEPAWRLDYLQRMRETLIARGGDPGGAESTVAHMRERDYPISTEELRRIFGNLGFRAESRYYDAPGEPMAPYIAFCTAALEELSS